MSVRRISQQFRLINFRHRVELLEYTLQVCRRVFDIPAFMGDGERNTWNCPDNLGDLQNRFEEHCQTVFVTMTDATKGHQFHTAIKISKRLPSMVNIIMDQENQTKQTISSTYTIPRQGWRHCLSPKWNARRPASGVQPGANRTCRSKVKAWTVKRPPKVSAKRV